MDLRVDMHLFSELCEAIRRQEPVILHGRDQRGGVTRIELTAEVVRQIRLAGQKPSEPAKAG